MNVPEALSATRHAIDNFEKAVAMAREELASEMNRIHSELLEDRPKAALPDDNNVPYVRR